MNEQIKDRDLKLLALIENNAKVGMNYEIFRNMIDLFYDQYSNECDVLLNKVKVSEGVTYISDHDHFIPKYNVRYNESFIELTDITTETIKRNIIK